MSMNDFNFVRHNETVDLLNNLHQRARDSDTVRPDYKYTWKECIENIQFALKMLEDNMYLCITSEWENQDNYDRLVLAGEYARNVILGPTEIIMNAIGVFGPKLTNYGYQG